MPGKSHPTPDPEWIDEFSQLHGEEALKCFFDQHPDLVDGSVVEDLCDQIPTMVRKDMERATAMSKAARWLAVKIDDDFLRGRSERACGNLSHSKGDLDRAQRFYELALKKFESLSMDREAAITKTSGLVNLAYLGDHHRVFEWESSAREYFVGLNDRARVAILDNNIAAIHFRQDRWEQAVNLFYLRIR